MQKQCVSLQGPGECELVGSLALLRPEAAHCWRPCSQSPSCPVGGTAHQTHCNIGTNPHNSLHCVPVKSSFASAETLTLVVTRACLLLAPTLTVFFLSGG